MYEQTVGWIRPVGMPYRYTIRRIVTGAGLLIVHSKILKMPRWAYEELYPRSAPSKMPDEAWLRRLVTSTGSPSEIMILAGDDAVERLIALVGRDADPAKCAPGTIRHEFGVSCAENIGGMDFHLRVMHRPVDREEAARNLFIARKLIGI